MKPKPVLSIEDINPNVVNMEYAVRGPLVIRAGQIEKELKEGVKKPFKEIIRANIGDCHAMGQVPITFIRQVLAIVSFPALLKSPDFPKDAKKRASLILNSCGGFSVGSYSESNGLEAVRQHVAKYIEERDKFPSNPDDIVLSNGASEGIKNILKLFVCDVKCKRAGIMVPIPQYPLYSAAIVEYGMTLIGYHLKESQQWGLSTSELQRVIQESRKYCNPRAIVVINPGNPTGQVLSRKNIEEVVKFAHKERLFIFADEVYQENIYDEDSKFHSFKKVAMELGEPYNKIELASFMSASKGWHGECGLRGGYAEVINMHPKVKDMLIKSISAMLCSTTLGQATIDVVVNRPKRGEESYELFKKERTAVLLTLKTRAKMVVDAFNSFEGFKCNNVQGSMYAFPQITLPPKAIEAARKAKVEPDSFYASQLLENSGVCIVPGSGFGQKPGTYHFRTTILPSTETLNQMLQLVKKFHLDFVAKYK